MKHVQFGDRYVVRLYRDEEVIEVLTEFARREEIRAGSVSGIGAVRNVMLGYFDPATRKYEKEEFADSHEVTNLTGNIASLDGEPVLHLHATVADRYHNSRAGHLFSARVSVTVEVILTRFSGALERKWDGEIDLNLLHLP